MDLSNILDSSFYTKTCSICYDSKTGAKLKCAGCGLLLHQSCFQYSHKKKATWYCHLCDPNNKDLASREKRCDLCFREGGALILGKEKSKKRFVHISCARMAPNVHISSDKHGLRVANLDNLQRTRKKCVGCKKCGGFQLNCLICGKRSHVTCAMENNWRLGVEQLGDYKIAVRFCEAHRNEKTGSFLETVQQELAKLQGLAPEQIESGEDEWIPESESVKPKSRFQKQEILTVQPVEIEILPEPQKAEPRQFLNSDVEGQSESDNEPIKFTSPKKTKRKRETMPEPAPKRKKLNEPPPPPPKEEPPPKPPPLKKQPSSGKRKMTEEKRINKYVKRMTNCEVGRIFSSMAQVCKVYKKERKLFNKIIDKFFAQNDETSDGGWAICLQWCEYWGEDSKNIEKKKQFFETFFQFLARVRKIEYKMRPPSTLMQKITSLCEKADVADACTKIKDLLKPYSRIIPKKTRAKQKKESERVATLSRSNSNRSKNSKQHSKTIDLGQWQSLGIDWKDQLFGKKNELATQFESQHHVRIQLRGNGSDPVEPGSDSLHVLIEGDSVDRVEVAKQSLNHQISVLAHSKTTEMKKKMKYNSPPPPPRPRAPPPRPNGMPIKRQATNYISPHQRNFPDHHEDLIYQADERKLSQVERNCAPTGDGKSISWRLIERKDRSGSNVHFWWNRETNQTTFTEPDLWGFYSPGAISSDSEVELCPTTDDDSYSDDQEPVQVDQAPIVENLYKDLPKITTTCTEESFTTDLSATLSDHDDSFHIEPTKKVAQIVPVSTPPPPPPLLPPPGVGFVPAPLAPRPEKRKKTRFDHAPPTELQPVNMAIDLIKFPMKMKPSITSPKRSRSSSREKSSRGRSRLSSTDKSPVRSSSRRRRKRSSSSPRRRKRSRSKSRGRSRSSSSRSRRRRRRSGSRSHRRSSSHSPSRSSRSYSPDRERRRRRRSRSHRRRDRRKKRRSRSGSRRKRRAYSRRRDRM